ncbi:hypothetical protein ACN1C3_14280 [Pseudomonas sp. H11T01]|uniref:hypothetical protein n=1 Tax=Pseudomonas sp. H11T01 TaxID=3402749 RepID=UPI003AD73450
MKAVRCAFAIVLSLVASWTHSAPSPIKAIPDAISNSIAYGESKTGQLTIKYNDDEFNGEDTVSIKETDIAWEWGSKQPPFNIVKITDSSGQPVSFPLRINGSNRQVFITYNLRPSTAESLNNKLIITYSFKGGSGKIFIPMSIDAACVNSDYDKQGCNPDIWTCQIDRNSYPVLRIERPADDNSSQDAVRAHDRTHRFADKQYTIPLLQFLSVAGINVKPAPSCELDPVVFTKNPRASKVASFIWAQKVGNKIPTLQTETVVNGVTINRITVGLPEKITGYAAVNGSTAEYRFDVKDAPTVKIEENLANPEVVFSGMIECVLADGTFSVVRNADKDANLKNAKSPAIHLIIEKP